MFTLASSEVYQPGGYPPLQISSQVANDGGGGDAEQNSHDDEEAEDAEDGQAFGDDF